LLAAIAAVRLLIRSSISANRAVAASILAGSGLAGTGSGVGAGIATIAGAGLVTVGGGTEAGVRSTRMSG
jgi:hypothetical protein